MTASPQPLRGWRRLGLLALAGAIVWAGTIALGVHSVATAALLAIAIGGAVAAAAAVPQHPVTAFGILFLLASVSRPTIELPVGSMRLEQPAILAVVGALLISRRLPARRDVAAVMPVVVGLGGYLAVLLLASYLNAPDRAASLRFTLWTALSVLAGAVAFVLLRPNPERATRWLVLAAAGTAAIGIGLAVARALLGPTFDLGVQEFPVGYPKVYALSWEGNLYASYLAALVPFALEGFRRRPAPLTAAIVSLIVLGFALGLTRGAYLGMGAGLIAYFGAVTLQDRSLKRLVPTLGLSIAAVICAAAIAVIILPQGQPPPVAEAPSAQPSVTSSPADGFPGSTRTPVPAATPTPAATPIPYPDTVGFRAARIPVALEDMRKSPIIGLGASSFGQRHVDASQGGAPDHLGTLILAIPYESGLLGLAAFLMAILVILVRLARSAIRPGGSLAAAYLASIVSLLVAYQATNSMHFAMNWLLIGAALAVVLSREDGRGESTGKSMPASNEGAGQ